MRAVFLLSSTLMATVSLAPRLSAEVEPRPTSDSGYPRLASGLFAGAAVPAGRAAPALRMHDALGVSGVVGTDVGFRVHRNWELTPELFALIPFSTRECPEEIGRCDQVFAITVAGLLRFHPLAQRDHRVWVGAGPGGEWLRIGGRNYRGPLVALQMGADANLGRDYWLGAFIAAYAGSHLSSLPSGATGGSHIIWLAAVRMITDTPI